MIEENLHDWLLEDINFIWGSRKARIVVRDSDSKNRAMLICNVESICIFACWEWGRSLSINRLKVSGDKSSFVLEIQSGDELTFSGKELDFFWGI
ncbi:hypothetical protein JR065_19620 [Xanthomonas sp. AmX2]|uniref:hypothetical protein n=1 Tax=Xanthomonas sp. TaxID=29446 RepID=UPI00197E3556|nr:hypothetical protein [Xanthomonas sp.]MBN6152547.1 hypothetical protein [Xanthomonas sp.]